jgi:hypothetical protein
MQMYRWRRRMRTLAQDPSAAPATRDLPEAEVDLRDELRAIVRQALAELLRTHPRYGAEWRERLLGTDAPGSPPSRRAVEALRRALLDVLARRVAREGTDALATAMVALLRGTGTKSHYARALYELLDFLTTRPRFGDDGGD